MLHQKFIYTCTHTDTYIDTNVINIYIHIDGGSDRLLRLSVLRIHSGVSISGAKLQVFNFMVFRMLLANMQQAKITEEWFAAKIGLRDKARSAPKRVSQMMHIESCARGASLGHACDKAVFCEMHWRAKASTYTQDLQLVVNAHLKVRSASRGRALVSRGSTAIIRLWMPQSGACLNFQRKGSQVSRTRRCLEELVGDVGGSFGSIIEGVEKLPW